MATKKITTKKVGTTSKVTSKSTTSKVSTSKAPTTAKATTTKVATKPVVTEPTTKTGTTKNITTTKNVTQKPEIVNPPKPSINANDNKYIVDPFFSSSYYNAFQGNLARKIIITVFFCINIIILIFVFALISNYVSPGKFLNLVNMPSLLTKAFEVFELTNDQGQPSIWAIVSIWVSFIMIFVNFILIFVIYTFGSMRQHVRQLESTIL